MTAGLSVVVASVSSEEELARCLESVGADVPAGTEVIAAARLDEAAALRLATRFPGVRVIASTEDDDVFRLRTLGLQQATGEVVAMTEGHCTVAPGWSRAFLSAAAAGQVLVGGPLEQGSGRAARAHALYLVEYGALMPPLAEGPARMISGANAAYRRDVLGRTREVWVDVFHENEVHDAARAAGHGPSHAPGALAYAHLDLPVRSAAGHLFAGGRTFGAWRRAREGRLLRALRIATAPGVAPLLLLRIVRTVVARRPSRLGKLVLALPHLALFLLAWSAGEALGYLGLRPPLRGRTGGG